MKGREHFQECVRLAITSIRWSLRRLEIGLNQAHVTAGSELAWELRRAVAHSRAAIDSLNVALGLLEPPEADETADSVDDQGAALSSADSGASGRDDPARKK